MAIALKPAREHSYRLSVYQRRANDLSDAIGGRVGDDRGATRAGQL
jgi:hypothetical protein